MRMEGERAAARRSQEGSVEHFLMMGETMCLCAKGKKREVEHRRRERSDGQAPGDGIQDTGCGISLQQGEGYFIL